MTESINPSGQPEGWLFLRPEAVPDRWRDRTIPMVAVPLAPGEMAQFLADGAPRELGSEEEELIRLVGRGLSVRAMALELGITPRSVQYRLARLREKFGVKSTTELVAEAARRGF